MNQIMRYLWRPGLLVAALALVGAAFAAKHLVWEAEQVTITDANKAFKVKTFKADPSRKVSGNKVVCIEKLPKGEKVPKDAVSYQVKIPANGTYYLWARVRWSTGCGNSFLMSLSGKPGEFILGGDGTYDALHWICLSDGGRPRALRLNKGTVTFTLGSKESGAMADQFLLTTDMKYHPQGIYTPTPNLIVVK